MIVGDSLSKHLNDHLELSQDNQHRAYIGSSLIGHSCIRHIWYSYNKYNKKTYTAKQLRTFQTGKYLENLLIKEITSSGLYIELINEKNYNFQDKDLPEFQGNVDAILLIDNINVILEIKTAKDSSFKNFTKHGLYRWNQQYYSQIQSYMGMSNIQHAYVLVINKDTGEIHDEFLNFDKMHYEQLKYKAKEVINATEPPERINKNPMFYICNMCQYKEICHGGSKDLI